MTMPSGLIKGYRTSAGSLTPSSTTSFTITVTDPLTGTAPAVGDFFFILLDAAGSISTANTPGVPVGFTEVVTWQAMGTSTSTSWGLYVRKRQVGDTNYTINMINSGRSATVQYQTFWIDGANAADIPDWTIGTIQSRAASGGTVNTVAPSVTTTLTDSMVFAFGVERTTAAETTSDLTVSGTGWTKQLAHLNTSASGSTVTIASKGMASAGASGNVTFTTINTQAANGAALQVIIPAAAGVPDFPDSVDGYLWDGTDVIEGKWYVMGASDEVLGLDYAGMIHPGSPSITDMLSSFFYCGHRGGSANYPEMSLQSYTQAALRGYDALEISLARSSDGVWFGLHDASLDRTSLGTGGGSGTTYVASAMTWADIQTHDIRPSTIAPVNTDHQPYVRLEDILDAYLPSHVLFIDPKAAVAFRTELIGILQSYDGWQERIVAKYVPGNSTNSWLTAARAAGFVTNAMFYAADNFTTYHTQGDILGMEYGASGAIWASITGLGKPVMVHVCQNTTQVNTGITNGADGAMVSGIVQVPRVPGL